MVKLRPLKVKKQKGGLSSPTGRFLSTLTTKDGTPINQRAHPQTDLLRYKDSGSPLLGHHASFQTQKHY